MRKTIIPALAALLNVALPAHALPVGFTYHVTHVDITDLGTLGGDESGATDINDHGDIVGYAQSGYEKYHAFIYLNGQMFSLHDDSVWFESAIARGINNSREVVGSYVEYSPEDPWNVMYWTRNRPFHYQPGIWLSPMSRDVSPGLGYNWQAGAFVINDNGRSVGWAQHLVQPGEAPPPPSPGNCYDRVAVSWSTTVVTSPTGLFCIPWASGNGVDPVARDINNQGSVVGTDDGMTPYSMFLRKGGQMVGVPAPGGVPQVNASGQALLGSANGINNSNWVVGAFGYAASGPSPNLRAFIWDGTSKSAKSLGTLSTGTWSVANEINEQRMVTGTAGRKFGTLERAMAYLWHEDFGMLQLEPLRHTLVGGRTLVPEHCEASSLNNLKSHLVQVVGRCWIGELSHAVRWDVTLERQSNYMP
jgi:probable HAF family extracellular repeat protein